MIGRLVRVLLPVLVVGLGVGGAALLIKTQRPVESKTPEDPIRTVRALALPRQKIRHEVVVHGTVQPRTETTLVSEVTGRVIETHESFETGGFVSSGDTLLRIDPVIYEAAVASAEAAVAQAETLRVREQRESELARREWEKYGEGEPNPLVLRVPQLAEAQAAVRSAEATLKRALIDLDRTKVTSPYAGRIRTRFVEEGQYVTAGTAVALIYSIDYAEVRLPISADELGYLDLPLARTIRDDEPAPEAILTVVLGGRKLTWKARIDRTEGEVDPRTRVVHAVARVADPYGRTEKRPGPPLMVGMFVEARVAGTEVEEVVVVPRRSLRGGNRLLVVDSSSALRLREVEVIRLRANDALIGQGIEEGDRVCVSTLDIVVDGMPVSVVGSPTEGSQQ